MPDLLRKLPPKMVFAPPPANFAQYGWAYRIAASSLVGEFEDGGLWALPAIFLYRHALELYVKAIRLAWGTNRSEVLKANHKLSEHLPELEQIARDLRSHLDVKTISTIKNFDDLDPTSLSARYPEDKSGSKFSLTDAEFELKPLVSSLEAALENLSELFFDVERAIYDESVRGETV